LTFDGERFGTATTCLAYSYLQQVSVGQSSLASPYGSRTRVAAVKGLIRRFRILAFLI
jgi:hypothetical protein